MRGIVKGGLNESAGSSVKSVQRGEVSLDVSPKSIAISEVDLTKSFVIISNKDRGGYPTRSCATGKLINSTTLEIRMGYGSDPFTEFAYQVIELTAVKSIQKGSTTLNPTTTARDINISAIDITNSVIISSFRVEQTSESSGLISLKDKIVSATQINFEYGASSTGTVYIEWQVIEFN